MPGVGILDFQFPAWLKLTSVFLEGVIVHHCDVFSSVVAIFAPLVYQTSAVTAAPVSL